MSKGQVIPVQQVNAFAENSLIYFHPVRLRKASKYLLSISPIVSHPLRLLVPPTPIFGLEQLQSRQEFSSGYEATSALTTFWR
jgi:hypothetical protein